MTLLGCNAGLISTTCTMQAIPMPCYDFGSRFQSSVFSVVRPHTAYHLNTKAGHLINERKVVAVAATSAAFAALLGDGSVVSWGHPHHGGDSSSVSCELYNIRHIAGCWNAFAVIRDDNVFLCWGNRMYDGFARPQKLRNVLQLCGGEHNFICVHDDSLNSVTLWPPQPPSAG